jgi:hypothetical protein
MSSEGVKESPHFELAWPFGVSTATLASWVLQVMLLRAQLEGEKLVHREVQSPTVARATGSTSGVATSGVATSGVATCGVGCGVAIGVGCGEAKELKRVSADKSVRKDMIGDDLWITKDLG